MYPIEVKRSNIHGRGVFASKSIKHGSIIEIAPLISNIEFSEIKQTHLRDYVIGMLPRNSGKCAVMLGYASIYNHSDNNNAVWSFINDEMLIVVAKRDIEEGEEILVSYGNRYWKSRQVG